MKGNHTMTLQILGTMDGRQRGQIVRNERGQFTTIAGRNEVLQREINGYFENINRYKKYMDQNPDLKVLIDAEQAKVDAAQSEMRLNKMSRRGIKERVKNYRTAMEQQGLKGEALEEQVARYKEGLLAERKKHFNKLKGKKLATQKGKLKVKPPKEEGGFFKKLGNFFSKNKKTAGVLGLLAAGIGVVATVKSCGGEGDNKTTNPTTPPASTTEPAPATETPEPPVNQTEEPAEPSIGIGEFKDGKYKVKKGDSFWKIAEQKLINEYKKAQEAKGEAVDENYKPTDAEILKETKRLVEKNEYQFDEKHWNTILPIYEGDILKIVA